MRRGDAPARRACWRVAGGSIAQRAITPAYGAAVELALLIVASVAPVSESKLVRVERVERGGEVVGAHGLDTAGKRAVRKVPGDARRGPRRSYRPASV
jgi:hypothetical protein